MLPLTELLIFVVAGFCAQLIDGALGMAYGVSANALLLSLGVPPAVASANVHTAEVFTTAVSGLSHHRLGNVDKGLFWRLALPGIGGAIAGVIILTSMDGDLLRPYIALYLLAMGLVILVRAIRGAVARPLQNTGLVWLALLGGFLDAIGGGGWGPVVTSTLMARGGDPRITIGSVNASEFFVTFAQAALFAVLMFSSLVEAWTVIAGLVVGGVLAAPLAALVARRVPARPLMALVGIVIVLLNIRTLIQVW